MENLNKLLELEKREKSRNSRSGMTRHSRFGTTVAVRAVSSSWLGRRSHRCPGRAEAGTAQAKRYHSQPRQDSGRSEAQTSGENEESGTRGMVITAGLF